MWQSSANALRLDVIDVIVDLFCEPKKRGPAFVRQIRERIRNHSLLSTDTGRGNLLEFDHDEFRRFYLGEALGRALVDTSHGDLLSILSVDRLPSDTCDQALGHVLRMGAGRSDGITALVEVARSASPVSFARENCGALLIRLLSGLAETAATATVESVVFPLDALVGRLLANFGFSNCRFESTGISDVTFAEVSFQSCDFERLDIMVGDSLTGATFVGCRIDAVKRVTDESERTLYGPGEVDAALTACGAVVQAGVKPQPGFEDADARIEALEKFTRVFLRATQVNEDTVRAKFGRQGSWFIEDILPILIRYKIAANVEYRGKGVQGRYKLAVPMQSIQDALTKSKGDFDRFLSTFGGPQRD